MMSGLVGYGSSDEEDVSEDVSLAANTNKSEPSNRAEISEQRVALSNSPASKSRQQAPQYSSSATKLTSSRAEPSAPDEFKDSGLGLGSGRSMIPADKPPEVAQPSTSKQGDEPGGPSVLGPPRASSPIGDYRSVMQSLTLPSVPNFSIPPSPPGSPPPGIDAKVGQFLALKRQGVHFNEKLASSSALKNPSLLAKLLQNAGLEGDDAADPQYSNLLGDEVWNPSGKFPAWAYKEELEKARQEADKIREAEKAHRTRVDFVKPGDVPNRKQSRFDR